MGSVTRNTVHKGDLDRLLEGRYIDEPNGRLRLISATCGNDFGRFKS